MHPVDYIYRGHRLNPDAVAVEDGARGLSYSDLIGQVEAVACGLQALLPRPGGRIGVCAYNTIEHMVAILGVYAAGHVWVALNPRNAKPELDQIVATTGLDAVIVDEDCLDKFAIPDVPVILGRTTGAAENRSLAGFVHDHAGARPRLNTRPLDAAQTIKFTGGSTGRPKAVIQPYRAVNTSIATFLQLFGFDAGDVNLAAAPLTHGAAHYIIPILAVGGRHILIDQPKSGTLIDAFDRLGGTTAFMPPTMIYNILGDPAAGSADFSRVRHLHYGAAPMAPERIRQALDVFHGGLEVIYGQTEAPMLITGMTAAEFRDERNLRSVGRETLLMRTAIMGEDGEIMPPGETGEIVCRGDLLMSGYLDMPEATAETIVDGWLHTGDAGEMDDRGYLFIRDRLRDVIISGGFNVYPSDVEAAILQHPAVHDCIVFGVPDDKWGERVEVAVQVAPDAPFDPEALRAFVKERVGSVKTPKAVHVSDDLPKSGVGKVLRREAQRLFAPKDTAESKDA